MAPRYQPNCKICGAPRDPAANVALCAEHWSAYRLERLHASRAARPGIATLHARLSDYWRAGLAAGATETEAAWIMLACEIEFQRNGRPRGRGGWLRPFVAAELDYLRRVAPLRADRWAAPGAEEWAQVNGDGWDFEEAV